MKKIETLDGLRGFAVLMVVIHHLPPIDGGIFWKAVNAIPVYLKVGYFGVDIFFVLSGFLITKILIKDKQREDFSFKRFYLKRALRIFPIYFLTLLAVGFLFSWDGMLPVLCTILITTSPQTSLPTLCGIPGRWQLRNIFT